MYFEKLDSEGNVFSFTKTAQPGGSIQFLKTRYNGI
jgi:hypothetical protein